MQHEAIPASPYPPNRDAIACLSTALGPMPRTAVTGGRGADVVIESVGLQTSTRCIPPSAQAGGLRPSTSDATKPGRVSCRRTWCSRRLG
jgi:hypothetical protein